MRNLLSKINKAKVAGFLVLAGLVLLASLWLATNYDVALYTLTRPEDVRMAKVVRQALQKQADANFLKELSIK